MMNDTVMTKRNKNSEAVHVGAVVTQILARCRNESIGLLERVETRWTSLVGEAVAANARPVAIKGRLLLIHVSSSVWLHQLVFLQNDILDKINEDIGDDRVLEIKFKIGTFTS